MHIDLSQLEVALQFLAPLLLDYTTSGRVAARNGNRSRRAAPHNAYPCGGDDRWCVITVLTDGQWLALRRAMGDPDWACEPDFETLLGRKRNEERLDELVGQWTRRFDAHDPMRMLQKAGVPAGAVQTCEDLFADPQLTAQGHYAVRRHAEIGDHAYDTFPPRLSKTPGVPQGPAPCLGEHNETVYRDILGLGKDEIADLMAQGAID